MLTKKNVTVWLAAIPYFIGVTINEIHLSFDGYIEGRGTVHVGQQDTLEITGFYLRL